MPFMRNLTTPMAILKPVNGAFMIASLFGHSLSLLSSKEFKETQTCKPCPFLSSVGKVQVMN
jgi:hypothetical protein